ncbi:type II toxin-antitoxin system VapC family toxin [Methylotenera sp.]|uniref:type II toxin-antitoxin system VapC family toxin n=1 Tax=Methylotenera sp. TaxID=2051956 RepID=UPI00272F818F|nr:type II toxin-antitoxin system VapC family toxin [Methylotenera sp.]MDP2071796.1 type II toxin-antitoxin system VapC family toxin [Methylotenera sp.]MDP3005599.1 type II toxin-antitoxin system VapC family toxin [Methylotenera sp.]
MVKVLLDTNTLIDYLNGIEAAKMELERFDNKAISQITWMEVMIGTTAETQVATKLFLATFELLNIDDAVSTRAVILRQTKRVKLPDAIIWATAQVNDRLLITRNSNDFAPNEPGVLVPYQL